MKRGDKRALSGIVTSLILIVLVLVAAGIVWAVYNSLIKGSADEAGLSAKCLGISLSVSNLTCYTDGCGAMVVREDSSNTKFDGFEYSFVNPSKGTDYADSSGNLAVKKMVSTPDMTLAGTGNTAKATEFRMRVYFNKENGDKYYCSPIIYKP